MKKENLSLHIYYPIEICYILFCHRLFVGLIVLLKSVFAIAITGENNFNGQSLKQRIKYYWTELIIMSVYNLVILKYIPHSSHRYCFICTYNK